jgi:TonB family protein
MVVAAFALTAGAAGAQEPIVSGTELANRPARAYIVVAPRYPKEAATQKREATVDVLGRVSADGLMQDPTFRSSSDDPEFQREVSEVIRHWVFKAPIDSDTCVPKGGEGQVRVWFEVGAQGPKVSISATPEDVRISRERTAAQGTPAIKYKDIPRFPSAAIKRGVRGGRVIVIARVDQAGDVASVALQDLRADRDLMREAARAVKEWKFDTRPWPYGDRSHFCAEIPIDFKLTD